MELIILALDYIIQPNVKMSVQLPTIFLWVIHQVKSVCSWTVIERNTLFKWPIKSGNSNINEFILYNCSKVLSVIRHPIIPSTSLIVWMAKSSLGLSEQCAINSWKAVNFQNGLISAHCVHTITHCRVTEKKEKEKHPQVQRLVWQ